MRHVAGMRGSLLRHFQTGKNRCVPRAQDVADEITRLIDNQVWLAGQKLPPERKLCEQFGSARLTLRRALDLVAQSERIVRHAGRGCYVRGDHGGAIMALSGGAVLLRDLARSSPADLMELRLIVEPAAASLAAVRATREDLTRIERACGRVAEAEMFLDREQADADFHLTLFEAARNPVLISLCKSINEVRDGDAWTTQKRKILTPERCQTYDRQHAAVVSALLRRDVEGVAAAVREHLGTLRTDFWGPGLI
jgi:DNA-binding FadR family transcriptional regulator